jgi:NhaA family Na+:H+ antiporter
MDSNKQFYFAPWEKMYEKMTMPFEEFIHRQTSSGILLIVCTMIALIIANSPLVNAYNNLLHMQIGIIVGKWQLTHNLHHWINDGLMTIFFG